jgi:hypothetical protein
MTETISYLQGSIGEIQEHHSGWLTDYPYRNKASFDPGKPPSSSRDVKKSIPNVVGHMSVKEMIAGSNLLPHGLKFAP